MSRFKKPLSGLSRLSDRGGGGRGEGFITSSAIVGTGNTVPVPTHEAGDLLLFTSTRNNSTVTDLPSGFTNIANFSNATQSLRAAFSVSDGTVSSVAANPAGTATAAVLIFRGYRSVGNTAILNDATSSGTIPAPAIGLTSDDALVAVVGSRMEVANSDQNFSMAAWGLAAFSRVFSSTFPGAIFTRAGSGARCNLTLELLP